MPEQIGMQVNVLLRGKDAELFSKLKEIITKEYQNVPGYRITNAQVLRIIINKFAEIYPTSVYYSLLIRFLREKHPQVLNEFNEYLKSQGIEVRI